MLKFSIALLLGLTTFLGFGQEKGPVSWKIASEKIDPLTYKVNLRAVVAKPFHIYPTKSAGGGPGEPTDISFEANPNIEILGGIEEHGVEEVPGKRLPYYAQGVTFSWKVKLKSTEPQVLGLTVKYMACNDQMCLPPAKKSLSLTINGDQTPAEAGGMQKEQTAGTGEKPYQDFQLPDTEGKLVAAKDIVEKSKYTFIDFWASWCAPCRAQGRALIPLYQKYESRGLRVIAVSLDTDAEKWKKAIQADGYAWTNLSDLKGFESPLARYYGITAIPRNFLIDHLGNIIARDLHGQALEDKLAELFNN